MVCTLFVVFQSFICSQATKHSPQETTLSPFSWKVLCASRGQGQREQRGGGRAGRWGSKARGQRLLSGGAGGEKAVGGFHLPDKQPSQLLLKKGCGRDPPSPTLRVFTCAGQRGTGSAGPGASLPAPSDGNSWVWSTVTSSPATIFSRG